MERGAKAVVVILAVAVILGTLIMIFNPAYRGAFAAHLKSTPEDSPIWKSNTDYYPNVGLEKQEEDSRAK
ncbi:MAG: hypothetical protein KJ626_00215 [Verrucomicrobia bacterium]|nr:hypothetical protein [Verrucomicrobiota bacterium]